LLALPLLIGPPVPLMFVFAIFAGLCVAPLISVRSEVVRAAVPAGTGTEAFTWTTVSITVGAAAGSALAGPLVEAGGWRAGVAACCFPLVGFVAAVSRRHLL
jgi:MFS family permease